MHGELPDREVFCVHQHATLAILFSLGPYCLHPHPGKQHLKAKGKGNEMGEVIVVLIVVQAEEEVEREGQEMEVPTVDGHH